MKVVPNIVVVVTAYALVTASVRAAIADASQSLAANPVFYSTEDNVDRTAAGNDLSVSFVTVLRETTVIGFSPSASQPGYVNGSSLALAFAPSGMPAGYPLITNASWTFPTNTFPAPSQPLVADLSDYSTDDNLGWIAASSKLAVSFVPNPGETTALQFSYTGNHPDYLNGSILKLTSTISGLPTGLSLNNIQLSYDIKWSMTANTVTNIWAYSINGGAQVDFQTNAVTGNTWQTADSTLAGVTLNNGDIIAFSDTISGAVGNNGNLDFDNIEITSDLVPEPSLLAVASLGISATALHCLVRVGRSRLIQPSARQRRPNRKQG